MGISPELFGPSFWGAMHYACIGSEDSEKVRQFISLYAFVLPCRGCREHFASVLEEFPVPDSGLFEWSVMVHNLVNVRLGKPEITPQAAFQIMFKPRVEIEQPPPPPESPPVHVVIPWILILFLILIILFIKLKK